MDEDANAKNGKGDEIVESISKDKESGGGRLKVWIVKTDEEEQCARMAVSSFPFWRRYGLKREVLNGC